MIDLNWSLAAAGITFGERQSCVRNPKAAEVFAKDGAASGAWKWAEQGPNLEISAIPSEVKFQRLFDACVDHMRAQPSAFVSEVAVGSFPRSAVKTRVVTTDPVIAAWVSQVMERMPSRAPMDFAEGAAHILIAPNMTVSDPARMGLTTSHGFAASHGNKLVIGGQLGMLDLLDSIAGFALALCHPGTTLIPGICAYSSDNKLALVMGSNIPGLGEAEQYGFRHYVWSGTGVAKAWRGVIRRDLSNAESGQIADSSGNVVKTLTDPTRHPNIVAPGPELIVIVDESSEAPAKLFSLEDPNDARLFYLSSLKSSKLFLNAEQGLRASEEFLKLCLSGKPKMRALYGKGAGLAVTKLVGSQSSRSRATAMSENVKSELADRLRTIYPVAEFLS